jgi:hypothetical protein
MTGAATLESSLIQRNSLDATGCADWLVERARLETAASREVLPKESGRKYWGSFVSNSACIVRENEFAVSSVRYRP